MCRHPVPAHAGPGRLRRVTLGVALAALLPWAGQAQVQAQVADAPPAIANRQAFSQPLPGLDSDAQREEFNRGRSLFRRAWIAGPRSDADGDGSGGGRGLGPLYNRLSCVACHPGNGRGQAPDGPGQRLQSMLVRLSVPGRGPHGAPRGHPAYGDQFNEEGVPGVPGEGRVLVQWQPVAHRLAGGGVVVLRRPLLRFDELAYGPLGPVLTSPRVGPAVYGQGLLQAVPDEALQALARRRQPDGVQGRLNTVWDPVAQRLAIGRFGWKANTASLVAQVVQAAHGDLGLRSPALPGPGCTPVQTACLAAAAAEGDAPDLSADEVAALLAYLQQLAPPVATAGAGAAGTAAAAVEPAGARAVPTAVAPRPNMHDERLRGQRLFAQLRCVACHVPTLPQPGGRPPIAPYTDLLLHDLGPGLADGRPDFRASARQWRTAPLWGLGQVPTVNEHAFYLHDGRARGLREAVLWHGGEATASRRRFERLPAGDQAAVLAFVGAL